MSDPILVHMEMSVPAREGRRRAALARARRRYIFSPLRPPPRPLREPRPEPGCDALARAPPPATRSLPLPSLDGRVDFHRGPVWRAPRFRPFEDGTRLGGGRYSFAFGRAAGRGAPGSGLSSPARHAEDRRRGAPTAPLSALIGGDPGRTTAATSARRPRRAPAPRRCVPRRPGGRGAGAASNLLPRNGVVRRARGHALDPRHPHRHPGAGQRQPRVRRHVVLSV